MTAIISLLVILPISVLITRVFAVALTLTGLSGEAARFQARSAFTRDGDRDQAKRMQVSPHLSRPVWFAKWGGGLPHALRELFAAFTVALTLSVIFATATWKRGRRKGSFWLFLILFFGTWEGGVWMKPFGPAVWGIRWLFFLLVGAVVALVLAVGQSRPKPQGRQVTIENFERMKGERDLEQAAGVTLTILFWVLLLTLLGATVVRYVV